MYEFIKVSVSVIDMSRFDPESDEYKEFNETLKAVKREVTRNRNKDDIRMMSLDEALQRLFANLDIRTMEDLEGLTTDLKEILAKAMAINAENDRLAAKYDGNYALVKTYQDAVADHADMSNKDIEGALNLIYGEIKGSIDTDILIVQGRQGFIDETKKRVVRLLLKAGLYKKLKLSGWIDSLLSGLYTNLQNYR